MHVQPRTGARIDMKRTLLSWSSGKDSAWSLYLLRNQTDCEVVGLLTTFNQEANRVAMHAVRRSLVEAQAVEPHYTVGVTEVDQNLGFAATIAYPAVDPQGSPMASNGLIELPQMYASLTNFGERPRLSVLILGADRSVKPDPIRS